MINCTARFRLLNVGSSGLRWWCMHRSASPGGSASLLRSLGRSLGGYARVSIRLFVQWRVCRCPNPPLHFSVLNLAKILLNNSFFYIGGGEKFIKGVFARFRPRPACVIVPYSFRDIAWRGKAESFLYAWRGYYTPPTQSSLCARTSALRASVACAQSLLFPKRNLLDKSQY